MLQTNSKRVFARNVVAAFLALFFSFSSLAALAAQSVPSPAGMACCRNKEKSCCRKSHNPDSGRGAVISGRTCASDCGQATLGSIATPGYVPVQTVAWGIATDASVLLHGREVFTASILIPNNLQQRPPPALSLG
jgi:hypothetical protein